MAELAGRGRTVRLMVPLYFVLRGGKPIAGGFWKTAYSIGKLLQLPMECVYRGMTRRTCSNVRPRERGRSHVAMGSMLAVARAIDRNVSLPRRSG